MKRFLKGWAIHSSPGPRSHDESSCNQIIIARTDISLRLLTSSECGKEVPERCHMPMSSEKQDSFQLHKTTDTDQVGEIAGGIRKAQQKKRA